jgi:hypothetical protein
VLPYQTPFKERLYRVSMFAFSSPNGYKKRPRGFPLDRLSNFVAEPFKLAPFTDPFTDRKIPVVFTLGVID